MRPVQTQPLHCSSMETETARQSPIIPSEGYGLNAVHLLRRMMGNMMGPSVVTNAIHVQQAVNLPVFSTNNRVTDGNKTFLQMGQSVGYINVDVVSFELLFTQVRMIKELMFDVIPMK